MKMRLISGKFGGRFIDAPVTSRTHPMGERIRGALFNILGDLTGMSVLDAFAGTGSLGFEALSRGASSVVFVERDRVAQKVLRANVDLLGVGSRAHVIAAPVAAWDESSAGAKFDLIFADPPYHDLQPASVSRLARHLGSDGVLVLSHPGKAQPPAIDGLKLIDQRSYGDAALALYKNASIL